MTAFDFMAGDHDYRAAAEQKTVADLEQQINALMARGAEDRAQLVAMEQRHEHLFTAVEALSKSPDLSQYVREQIAAVLVDHLKGWSKS